MFVGHFGVGLAGRAATPRVSLGTWFLAVQFLDLLWPVFLLLGWEHVRVTPGYTRLNALDFYDYPISHSLFSAVCWGFAFAVAYWLVRRRSVPRSFRTGLLLGAGVLSHWVLDFLTHRPDLPLVPGMGRYVGLGLWDHPVPAIALELALYGLGIALYLRATRARDGVGRFGLWGLLAVLLVLWLSSFAGPPPDDERIIAWASMIQLLLVAWAYWVDRHREPTR
ncbi:MAG TPA: hypothetical protein VLT87_05050 [Thermoanaerobaculia bacterium]|nr:hypothetical protein [Thermoanaerobaculia bacterium]